MSAGLEPEDAPAHDFSNLYTYDFNQHSATPAYPDAPAPPLDPATGPLLVAQDASGASGIGSTIWDASIVLSKYFEKIRDKEIVRVVMEPSAPVRNLKALSTSHLKDMQRRRNPFRGAAGGGGTGARVIELGAGTGLLGLVVARTFPVAEVVLTDKSGSLDLLRFNAEKNCADAWRDGKVRVEELMWGDEKRAQELGTFDVIVVADCVHWPSLFDPLLASLRHLSHTGTVLYIAYETRNFETEVQFFERLGRTWRFRNLDVYEFDEKWRDEENISVFVGGWKSMQSGVAPSAKK